MNRTKLKNYAPQARRDFIQAMTLRAAYYGLTAKATEPVVELGDVAVIGGREHPRAVARKREKLESRINQHGFNQTMEALAYTWFNRLVAIRYMELHGYLEHGYRVLSHPEGKATPEILEHAEHVELPGLKKDVVIDLKLAGSKESELYRLLLTAQCNALHSAMPFLFERIDDETELLLADNLLHSDSLIRKLVSEIDEEDWKQVEIIGWLYQFYISEKKDEVIGKVVASEDIPAATQLFTPNWIVKYLVQNTLGRQWLATYPQSSLRQQMEYYIEPAEQTPAVQEQLKAITPTSLDPEDLTLLDPACGSGHILVEAYDLFKAIYQERGHRAKDIPALILQKNLFGLEIDDRAAQLAAFALTMKARADDRRIFDSEAKPNILAFEDSQGMNAADITHALNSPLNKDDVPSEYLFEEIQDEKDGLFSKKALAEKGHVSLEDIASLLELFENAKTLGSLIQVPLKLTAKLPEIDQRLNDVLIHGDLTHAPASVLKPLSQQARLLAKQYAFVVANPPYMGSKNLNDDLRVFARKNFSESKSDLFAFFSERMLLLVRPNGHVGLMTPFTWMFISSYEHLRKCFIQDNALCSLIQPEYHAFFDSAYVPICTFVMQHSPIPIRGDFIRLTDFYGEDKQQAKALEAILDSECVWRFRASGEDFAVIPGLPVAYWISKTILRSFKSAKLSDVGVTRRGLQPGNKDRFVRYWHESNINTFAHPGQASSNEVSNFKWFPLNSGGHFRKWFGNVEHAVNWWNNGEEIKASNKAIIPNEQLYFQQGITWSKVSSGLPSFRLQESRIIPGDAGPCFFSDSDLFVLLGLMNSNVSKILLSAISPTLNFQVGDVANLPCKLPNDATSVGKIAKRCVQIAREDWDASETSFDFSRFPLIADSHSAKTVGASLLEWERLCNRRLDEMRQLEEENNRLFIDAFGLQNELFPDVPDDQITLYRPDRAEDIKRLVSYAIGCIMGRYSLDKPGPIYAHSGNQAFDPNPYHSFRADDDGIIPLLQTDWGIRDDAANRIEEFVGVAWPKENLAENLKCIADNLGPTSNEQPRDTIRRYLATGFYKHHLSMYKKRPIYWLFSSGKQRAFQCLVYLHRYHEGTLARMRTEYVILLQGQIAARIDQLEGDKVEATSTSHRKKLQKEQDDLKKQQAELLTFEEKLKHAADQKISLDLDDGVKMNYGKFGDLLAEVKAVTGGKDEE